MLHSHRHLAADATLVGRNLALSSLSLALMVIRSSEQEQHWRCGGTLVAMKKVKSKDRPLEVGLVSDAISGRIICIDESIPACRSS
jgi:hypothetical protein